MPIIDLQRRLHEAGRIRIGEQVATGNGKTRPSKLETFRFTSLNEDAINALAGIHGGIPAAWDDAPTGKQWEVVTDSDHIRVMVPPQSMSFSQFYELWSGGGCQRRCDGEHMFPGDEPCICDPDARECKPHTRISVMLADLPSSGLWRLDTQGWYAATELSGGFELANLIAQASGKAMLPASLRLDQREVKRPGQQVRKFPVPVIDFDLDLRALVGDISQQLSPVTPVPALPVKSFAEQLTEVDDPPERAPRANAAEPIKATGRRARTAAEANAAEHMSREQGEQIVALFGQMGFAEKDLRQRYIVAVLSRDDASANNLTPSEADSVIAALQRDLAEDKTPTEAPQTLIAPEPTGFGPCASCGAPANADGTYCSKCQPF